ncbi:hypothetical protein L6R50_26130 [Myxococcota bacterium]|nr:hypothetical protein [Myxococcota bacterium]MCK6576357.1 hypothetical protein [Myxococcota bacterium]
MQSSLKTRKNSGRREPVNMEVDDLAGTAPDAAILHLFGGPADAVFEFLDKWIDMTDADPGCYLTVAVVSDDKRERQLGRLDGDGDPEAIEWLRSVVLEEGGAAGTRLRLRAWAPGGKPEGSMTATMVIGVGGSGTSEDRAEDIDESDAVEAPVSSRSLPAHAPRPAPATLRGPCADCAALARTVAGLREDLAALQGKVAGLVDGAANQDRKIGQVVGAYRDLRESHRAVRGDVEEMAVAIAALAEVVGAKAPW